MVRQVKTRYSITLLKKYRKDVMYVLDFEKKLITKMNNKTLAIFLNGLPHKEFIKFGFTHTKKLAINFIKKKISN